MATAPTPGIGKRIEDSNAAKRIMTITLRGWDPVTIAINNVPIKEKMIVRKATGLAFETFIKGEDAVGEDSVVVLWWLARRGNGEPFLTFDTACEDWPDGLEQDDVDVTVTDPDEEATDPER